jgi:hypothetical protein
MLSFFRLQHFEFLPTIKTTFNQFTQKISLLGNQRTYLLEIERFNVGSSLVTRVDNVFLSRVGHVAMCPPLVALKRALL